MASSYDVGTRAWQPDATEGWVASELVSKVINGSKVQLMFKLENEEVRAQAFVSYPARPSKGILTDALDMTDPNGRGDGRVPPERLGSFSAASDEPDHA